MPEFITTHGSGATYEDALAQATIQLKNICGHPDAQVFRREVGNDPVPMIDWLLERTETNLTIGGTSCMVEAEFFLYGSDD